MELGKLALRGVAGPLFVGHGTQKLFGWFGGPGRDGTAGMMEKLELRPARRHALLVGVAEAGGGLLLALGAFTPLATMLLTGSMTTAIRKVHAPNGPWVTKGGWEYNAVLMAALAALAEHGPGSPSVDSAAFPRLHGPAWALASLAGGVAGSFAVERPPFSESPEPVVEPSGRFTREEQRVSANA